MADPIVSIAEIQRRARKAHVEGLSADDCPFHPWTAAYTTWQAEFARLELEQTCEELAG